MRKPSRPNNVTSEWAWAENNQHTQPKHIDPEMWDVADVHEWEERHRRGKAMADTFFNIATAIVVTAAVVVIYFSLFIWEH